jgi:hypothetical protein
MKLSIGKQIRITDYNHKDCGQFGRIIHVSSSGNSGIAKILDSSRLAPFTVEQVCDATPLDRTFADYLLS